MIQRFIPIFAVALVAFVAGVAVGTRPSASTVAAEDFAGAWARQDFGQMHALLNQASSEAVSAEQLENAYLRAQQTATVKTVATGEPAEPRDAGDLSLVAVPITVVTVAFGTVQEPLDVPYRDDGVEWSERLLFPGLEQGESLRAETELPERAPILARDGVPLAEGPALARSSPIGSAANDVVGYVGEPDEEQQRRLEAAGLPDTTPVGTNGLERAFDAELDGEPGGELYAVDEPSGTERLLAQAAPQPREPIRTTIDPELQAATVDTLGGRNGGIVALDARNGAVRAMAGLGFSAPQPPGSTFKVVTTAAALEQELVDFDDEFPAVTGVDISGRYIENAYGESCGGTFPETFAHSCNSVFLPLSEELGAERLVEIAERFGFNEPPQLFNGEATEAIDPPTPTIPTDMSPGEEVAVTGIGQGRMTATPLLMASIAQTVANRGVRSSTPIVSEPALRPAASRSRAVSRRIARQLTELMVGVVEGGTGDAAAIEGIEVAGKTGTAELGPKPDQGDLGPDETPEQMVDAWFIAFAPASEPRLAVAVMLIDSDADGGTVAAPAAAEVLAAGLD